MDAAPGHIRHARRRQSCPKDPLPNGILQQNLRPTIGPHRMHNPGPFLSQGLYRLITRMAQCVQKWVNRPGRPRERAIARPVLFAAAAAAAAAQ